MIHHIFTNNCITLIFSEIKDSEGRPLVKHLETEGVYSEEDIVNILKDKEELSEQDFLEEYFLKELSKTQVSKKRVDVLLNHGFEVEDSKVKFHLPISIPKSIVEACIKAVEDDNLDKLTALKNFWLRLGKCPNNQSRESAYDFLKDHKFEVTPNGFLIGYRNVKDVSGVIISNSGESVEIPELYSKLYNLKQKVKGWKKKPRNYNLKYKDGKLSVTNSITGILANFQDALDTASFTFTDNHTKTMKIVMGEVVSQERRDCDTDIREACSNGLHIGNTGFVTKNSFGNVGLVVLIDPVDIVAVPEYDYNKMRVCRYLPFEFAKFDKHGYVKPFSKKHNMFEEIENILELDNSTSGIMDFTLQELTEQNIVPSGVELSVFDSVGELKHKVFTPSTKVIRL